MIWIQLLLSAAFIIIAGMRLTRSAATLAAWTGLSTAWAGAFLLPIATTMPELVTSWRSAVIAAPDLAAGNLLGSSLFNLSIIAFIDIVQGRGSLSPHLRIGHVLTAVLVIMLACVTILGIALPGEFLVAGRVGWPSLVLVLIYLLGNTLLLRYERKLAAPSLLEKQGGRQRRQTALRAAVEFFLACVVIFFAGVILTDTADLIAAQTGLGRTFVGSLFIAVVTSLPEAVTTYTAVRIGALDMAVANVLGANFICLMLFSISDIFYQGGSLFASIALEHIVTAAMIIVMVCIFLFGLIYRSQKHFVYAGYDSLLIALVYISTMIFLFITGNSS